MTSDREHAAVLRSSWPPGDPDNTPEEEAAIARAIELLEMNVEWVGGIPLMLIAQKKRKR